MSVLDRIAAAPISWGVCEVPGWGTQMPVERVLAEMRELGLHATEAGPGLYKPLGAGSVDVGGFVAVLEDAGYDGWYVLEQDAMLDAQPPQPGGPIGDVRASQAFLRSVLAPAG